MMQNKNKNNKKTPRQLRSTIHSTLHEQEHQRKKRHSHTWIGLALFFIGSFFAVSHNAQFLKISILPTVQHAPFDGAVFPIQKSPDWVHLTPEEYKLSYTQIPSEKLTDLPAYNPGLLATPVAELQWNNPAHNAIRNAKITFSVPYMGSYRLNGKEYDGSHLAVDIKVPSGTPIFAMANGVVTKVSLVTSGFGHHVVIRHDNMPGYPDGIFSSYSHLGSVAATEQQVVTKGQLIGYSGETGFATTPHLHFQIDRADAPWHPYWAFTYKEASDAGLNFVEAINAGLGKEKAVLMTISPMAYIEKYLNFTTQNPNSGSAVSENSPTSPSPVLADAPPSPPVVPASVPVLSNFNFEHARDFPHSSPVSLTLFAKDEQQNPVSSFEGDIILLLTGNVGTLSKVRLTSNDFSDGRTVVEVQNPQSGTGRLVVLYEGKRFSSEEFVIQPAPQPVLEPTPENPPSLESTTPNISFKIVAEDAVRVGRKSSFSVQAVDASGNIMRDFQPQGDLNIEIVSGSVDLSPSVLKPSDFSAGEGLFSMVIKKSDPVSLKISYSSFSSMNQVYHGKLFADISDSHPYHASIEYLKNLEIVGGYEDGTFQPSKKVSRVEALKIILKGAETPLVSVYEAPAFSDVDYKSWYAPFLMTAYKNNIVRGYPDQSFRPHQGVSRGEFLKMLITAFHFSLDTGISEKPYDDVEVSDWFAPYAAFAKEKNLLPQHDKTFDAGAELDRGEVVEIMYRLLNLSATAPDA